MAKEATSPTPNPDEALQIYAAATAPSMQRVREMLIHLETPPQVLLLEGGSEEQRHSVARWWAASLHCMAAAEKPCLTCPVCLQIAAGFYNDLLMFDGRISNKEDEENPGIVRAFSISNARLLKERMADAPRRGVKRVVILSGIDISRETASNALLKALEEPSLTTVFVLLTPQREQLLPTLVSRSWVVTLPWDTKDTNPDLLPWDTALATFLETGQHWWEMTSAKGSVDQIRAQQIIVQWQKALTCSFTAKKQPSAATTELVHKFSCLPPAALHTLTQLFETAHTNLQYGVSPPRVLDALAASLYITIHNY